MIWSYALIKLLDAFCCFGTHAVTDCTNYFPFWDNCTAQNKCIFGNMDT